MRVHSAALLLAAAAAAAALHGAVQVVHATPTVTTAVTTCGCFSNVKGNPDDRRFCGDNCVRGSGMQSTCESNGGACPPTGQNEVTVVDSQVRWGISATLGLPFAQSGMGFTGEEEKQVSFGREFYVGRLTHFNHPIIGPASGTTMHIALNFTQFSPPIFRIFGFELEIDETYNNRYEYPENDNQCPYKSTVDCSDKITFGNDGRADDVKFKVGPIEYTLAITGFKETRQSTSIPQTRFISNEQRENNAFMFAKVVAVCPSTCVDGAGPPKLVRGADGTFSCKCVCPATACANPDYKRDETCQCTCDKAKCNGYPGDPNNNCACLCPAIPAEGCPRPRTEWDPVRCACKCPSNLCGTGNLANTQTCTCECGQKKCSPGRTPDATCECKCLLKPEDCKGDQVLELGTPNKEQCECKCDPKADKCPKGFVWELVDDATGKCACVCQNKCGSGCTASQEEVECVVGSNSKCCKDCKWTRDLCDDENLCTINDRCGGSGEDCKGELKCPETADSCTYYDCDPAVGDCVKKTRENGARCGFPGESPDDYDRCARKCVEGTCTELAQEEIPSCVNDPQNLDPKTCRGVFCNKKTGQCEEGVQEGKKCDDEDLCTFNDVCGADAVCVGEEKACAQDNPCLVNKCNPLSGECEPTPVAAGSVCKPPASNLCATEGVCGGGLCLFGQKCEPIDDKEKAYCNVNACNPTTGLCVIEKRNNGSKCLEKNGFGRQDDICGEDFKCFEGKCKGKQNKDTLNHTACGGAGLVVDAGAGDQAALIAGLSALGALLFMIVLAVILFMYVSKNALTDPSTWQLGNQVGVEANPLYDGAGGGGTNALYKG